MATVKIKFAPSSLMMQMHFISETAIPAVRQALHDHTYTESALFEVNGDGQDAADEVFDLTNNPSRQEECEEKYGCGRSLSVGDIVVVGEEQWLCMSHGWKKI
jgi:hypothetical protein